MDPHEAKLADFIQANEIDAAQLRFEQSCHSVAEAALAANADPKEFVKNICLLDPSENLIVAIVKGEDRVSRSRVARALAVEEVRLATAEEMLNKSGYPCGGTPSFGFDAIFLIDPRVMLREHVYTGGGSERALTRLTPAELQRANGGQVVRIRG